MGTKVRTPPRPLIPAGTHVARCVRIVDIGLQLTNFGKIQPTVIISWELPQTLIPKEFDRAGEVFMTSRTYHMSLHEKATLRKDLTAWRGKAFSDEEVDGWDVAVMIEEPCILTMIHATNSGKTYSNVAGVGPLMAGMQCPKQCNESLVYDTDTPDPKVYEKLPNWQQKLIGDAQPPRIVSESDPADSPPQADSGEEIPF